MMRRHSPYNYAFNNPVFFIDPDGMAPLPFGGSETGAFETTEFQVTTSKDGEIVDSQIVTDLKNVSVATNGTIFTGESNRSVTSNNAESYSNRFRSVADEAANADVSLDGGTCPDGDCGGRAKEINWSLVFKGSIAALGGIALTVGGGMITASGAGAPIGIGGLILGPSTIGLGTANIIEGFRGGNEYPTGPLEAIDIGVGGDGTWGQMGDVFSAGLPKNTASGLYMAYGLYTSKMGQEIINNSQKGNFRYNYPLREVQQDKTKVRKPITRH